MYGSNLNDLYSTYGSYGQNSSTALNALNSAKTATDWAMPALIISIVAAILIFFLFLGKRNEGKFTGFVGWLYEFLDFKKLAVEGILKILYIATALYITIMSFSMISVSFGGFLGMLIGGNIGVRIVYELMLVLLIVCKNTSEINKKMSNKE